MNAPTGTQHVLTHGSQRAVVTEMGAGLRSYAVDGRELVTSFAEDGRPEGCQGQQLMPWPNRIRDGKWSLAGTDYQLPVNEPERGNAIHGLVSNQMWTTVEQGDDHLTQRLLLEPSDGWPGTLDLVVSHRLSEAGLGVEVTARNLGSNAAPFGYAAHPYLLPPDGEDTVDDDLLVLPFTRRLEADERLLPVELHDVAGTLFDRRGALPVAGLELDTAFTTAVVADGQWQAWLQGESFRTVLWAGEEMDWLQVYTPSDRASIAIEPMTVGPDAYNPGPTHDDLVLLQPGESFTCRWGLRSEAVA